MTESNLTDKIYEAITNVFKKTQVFEKIENIKFYINSFVIISSFIGLTSIYINYSNICKIKKLEDKIKGTENVLKYNIEINRKQYQIVYNKLIEQIEQIKNELEFSAKLLDKINENQILKPEMISASTSISSFSPLKIILPPENDDWINHIIDKKDNNNNDGELINECYDSIPLNNLKKNTGLNWFFK
jgi:S-adenosylmethionine:tRNA-ribosyltransferase-isomerase (queuine synthetase)